MKKQDQVFGHILAMITIIIWGTTYVSTKVLLAYFSPVEILFIRFVIAFILLYLMYPKPIKMEAKHQLLFVGAGISGITLYYLLENIALTMTSASNVGIIITIAPFFTSILATIFLKTEKPKIQFYIGFVAAMIGVILISLPGDQSISLNPVGDFLALLAALAWAVYSICIRKISDLGFPTIQMTRHIFMYGLLFMMPFLFFMDFHIQLEDFQSVPVIANLLFLSVGASAICFVTWNQAVRILGALKSSVYIYVVPVVTLVSSVIILDEKLTPVLLIGAGLTLLGLWLSESNRFIKK
ncbi:drug/metabolite transporter (DMT)-like permease [Breznakia blatticola]|uniref:Drug/metabolite transporter (DMT)-like permease n=1 Tax=Breznakia blatticola TaxID=1754012 RepID=A0A4R8A5X6_9FIRM|nr:DMT family transporter [Breznakia blatticola]TDW26077.1 drug/metabolite transporter (DMT)-like permease [Breznakia blatticola]